MLCKLIWMMDLYIIYVRFGLSNFQMWSKIKLIVVVSRRLVMEHWNHVVVMMTYRHAPLKCTWSMVDC
jgi:hypothetical protein